MGLPLLLASGYLVLPLMYMVYNVIKTWIKKKSTMQTPLKAIIFSDPLGFFDFWRNHEPCFSGLLCKGK